MKYTAALLLCAVALASARRTGAGNGDPSQAPTICRADGSDSTLVSHEICNKFYICAHGLPVPLRCPVDLQFNPNTDKCDYPENVNCADRVVPGPEDNDGGDDNDNTGAGNDDPSLAPEICAAEGSDSILVAHEKCNKFYICAHGVPVAVRCPATLFFNPNRDQCDYPKKVDCGDRIIPGPDDGNDNGDGEDNGNGEDGDGDNDNEDNGNGDNGGSGSGNDDPSQAGAICAAEGSDSILVAHENCNKFYICAHGVPVAMRCPGNLQFNPSTDQCDYSDNVNCADRVVPGPDDNDGGDDNDDNTGAGNDDPSLAPEICAAEGSDSILVAHEKCNKFYICAHGAPVALRCPSNTLFNPNRDICDHPTNVDCGDRIIPGTEDGNDNGDGNGNASNEDNGNGSNEDNGNGDNGDGNGGSGSGNDDPTQAGAICAEEGSDSILVAHENCNKFYICAHGVPVAMRCPGNLQFNPSTDQCDYQDNVNCVDSVAPGPGDGDDGDSDGGNGDGDDNTGAGNDNPSLAPEICAAEGSDSILVAHEQCNKFYICAHGVPVALRCPGDTLFNPNRDICDHSTNVDCGDRVVAGPDDGNDNGDGNGSASNEDNGNGGESNEDNGNGDNGDGNGGSGSGNDDPSQAGAICAEEGSDSILVAHEKCNKFYICAHGVPVAMRCPGNLQFNPSTDQCDYQDNVNCVDSVAPGPGDGDDGDSDGGNGDGDDNTGAGNDNPSLAPEICAAEGSDSILVAHEQCNKFYICAHGVPVALRCPGDTLFNPNRDICDHSTNVDCGDRVVPGPDDGNDNGDGNGSASNEDNGNGGESNEDNGNGDNGDGNGGSGSGNDDPSQAGAICAEEGSDSILVAHEKCNKFYICAHGVPVAMRCPGNLQFNPSTDQCDYQDNVNCVDSVAPGPGDGDDGDSDGGNGDGDDNTGAGNDNPSLAPEICAAEGSDSILVAHEQCNKFYICAHGVPVALRCPGDTLFNPNRDICDHSTNVDCGDRVVPGPDDGNDNGDGNGNASNEDNGNGGESNEDNGNGDNGDGNGGSGSGNDDPSQAGAICAEEGSDSILVAHEKCNKFYICAHGVPVAMRCPGNLQFNPSTDQCDYQDNVNCVDSVAPGPGDGDDGDSEGGNGDGDDNTGAGNDNPSLAPEICAAEGSDSILVAHEQCNKFYICAHGVPVALRCPGDTLFNPNRDICDHSTNVDCGDRIIPGTDDNDDGNDNGGDGNGAESNEDNSNGSESDEDIGNGGESNEDNGNTGSGNDDPSLAPVICAAEGSDGVLVAHEQCNKFYICVHGKPVSLGCPSNLYFNPNTDKCDYAENVNCVNRPVNPEEGSNEDNNSNDSGSESEEDSSESDEHYDLVDAEAFCAKKDLIRRYLPHSNCHQFFACLNGGPVVLTCPPGLLYQPRSHQCEWPHYVNCRNRVVPYYFTAAMNKHYEARKAFRR